MSCDLTSPLCSSCKAVTFTMLLNGFVHPKSFTNAVVSGRTCKLCRLMVYIHSKLQIRSPWSLYEVEKNYDTISDSFSSLPAVSREFVGREDVPYFETLEKPVHGLSWKRGEYKTDFAPRPKPVLRYGNFGDGSTIQVNACEGEFFLDFFFLGPRHSNSRLDSYYHSPDMVPLRVVTACPAPRNYIMLRKWLKNCIETH
jgi:hypothetical protein